MKRFKIRIIILDKEYQIKDGLRIIATINRIAGNSKFALYIKHLRLGTGPKYNNITDAINEFKYFYHNIYGDEVLITEFYR
jgi:hypothetical protein